MKILIPVLGFGHFGGYRVLSKLADELIKQGHSVAFINPDISTQPYFPTMAEILWVDNKGDLKAHNKNNKFVKATGFSNQKHLTRAFLKLDPKSFDIIIANHSLTTIPLKIAGVINKTLYYVQAYEPEFFHSKPGFKNKIFGFLSAFSYKMNLFTVVNAEIYLNFKELQASRVLYPGVDFSIFYPSTTKKIRKENEIIVGTVGRLEPQKGTYYVLEAFNKLKKKYPGLRLHVAFGNSKDFLDYEDVYCFQPHGDEALGEYYRTLDFYFCAGFAQLGAFHYPVVEAMSCGVSVITTQYYPADHSNAWLAAPKNIDDLVKCFEMAYNNIELREQKIQQALKDVQQFSWVKVGKMLNQYINELKERLVIE